MGNHEIDFHEFCDVMKRMSDKQNSWNDVTRECFAVFDRVSNEMKMIEENIEILRMVSYNEVNATNLI